MTPKSLKLHLYVCFALALGLAACSKKDGQNKASTASKTGASKAAKPKFEAPKNVLMYTGTDSPEKTLAALFSIAQKVTPLTPDPRPMVAPLISGYFRLANPMGIDIKKPLRFVLFDPKGLGRDPSALVIGLKDGSKIETIVGPIERKQNDRGNQWSYLKRKSSKYPVFVNTIENHMVLTRHADTFPKNKAFITTMLKRPMAGSGALYAQVENAITLFKPQIDKAIANMKSGALRNPQMAQSANMVNGILDSIKSFVDEVKLIELRLSLKPDGILLETISTAKSTSELSKTWSQLKSLPHDLLAKTPANASGVLSLGWTGTAHEKIVKSALAMANGLLGAPDQKMTKVQSEYVKLLDGRTAWFFFTPPSGKGLVGSGLVGIRDQSKAAAKFEAIATQLKDNPSRKVMVEQTGLKTEMSKAPKAIGDMPTFINKTTAVKPGTMNPTAMLGLDPMIIAFGKSVAMMAFGPKAYSILEQQHSGKLSGFKTSKAGARALKNAAKNTILLGYISPINVAQQARLGGMNPFAKTLSGIQSKSGIALSIGHDQGQLLTVLDIPTQLLVEAFQVFERVKGSF